MAWFIDADRLLADIEALKMSAWYEFGKKPEPSVAHNWYLSREDAVNKVRALCIKAQNVVDAEPVRHGRWIAHPTELCWDVCSVCGTGCKRREEDNGAELQYNYPYCPWCGAKMDGGGM